MDIVAINKFERIALTDSGEVLEITEMFDSDGDFTDDPEAALSGIAPVSDKWVSIDFSKFDSAAIN